MPKGTPTPIPILADGWWPGDATVDEGLAEDLAVEVVEDEDEDAAVEAVEDWEEVEEVVTDVDAKV